MAEYWDLLADQLGRHTFLADQPNISPHSLPFLFHAGRIRSVWQRNSQAEIITQETNNHIYSLTATPPLHEAKKKQDATVRDQRKYEINELVLSAR